MRIIVTGCAGFIGYHLTKHLLNQGFNVLGIDNLNSYYDTKLKIDRLKSIKNENFQFKNFSIENNIAIEGIFKEFNPEVVIHLAAQAGVRYSIENPQSYINSNLIGFFNIIEACKLIKVKHLIYASSSSVYGANTSLPFSTLHSTEHPLSLYAATKKSNELLAHTYSNLFNLPTTGLRFFTVYGPWGRPDMALFKFTKNILNGEKIDVYNNGNMKRDFTYVDDVVKVITLLIDKPPKPDIAWNSLNPNPASSFAPYKIYNVGNNNPVKLTEFIECIEHNLDKRAILNYLPLQPGDVPETFADVEDLFINVGYQPKTSVEDGVKKFLDWYTGYYGVKLECSIK